MHTNLLTAAVGLSDNDLLARLQLLASRERETCAELVAHLAVLDTRPTLYVADGFGSLFAYCTEALHLSEDAACNRIEAARACRRFPRILALLASGTLSLTAVRLIGRHLTAENHETVLARASQKSRREIEALVAEVAPRPDAPSCVRKLPVHAAPAPGRSVLRLEVPSGARPVTAAVPEASLAPPPRPAPPPVEALAPERYRVQFTIGAETREKLPAPRPGREEEAGEGGASVRSEGYPSRDG